MIRTGHQGYLEHDKGFAKVLTRCVMCSLAYSIVVRRIPSNDSITSCVMESVNPKVLNSSVAFPKGYFAYTQRGCCGGQYPNFFSSYPTGLQVMTCNCSPIGRGRVAKAGLGHRNIQIPVLENMSCSGPVPTL